MTSHLTKIQVTLTVPLFSITAHCHLKLLAQECLVNIFSKSFLENRGFFHDLRKCATLTQGQVFSANVNLLDKKEKLLSFGVGGSIYSIKWDIFKVTEDWILSQSTSPFCIKFGEVENSLQKQEANKLELSKCYKLSPMQYDCILSSDWYATN